MSCQVFSSQIKSYLDSFSNYLKLVPKAIPNRRLVIVKITKSSFGADRFMTDLNKMEFHVFILILCAKITCEKKRQLNRLRI